MAQWKPLCVVAELATGARSSNAATSLAFAFATVVLVTQSLGVRLVGVSPQDIKKWACPGARTVSKDSVLRKVAREFGVPLKNSTYGARYEHIVDAMAAFGAARRKEQLCP